MTRTPFNALYSANDGTAGTNCTVEEHGTDYRRTTVITLSSVAVPDIAGGAALAVGMLVYTLPAGECIIRCSSMSVAIQQVDGNITADTPDVGVGTTLASGANATLSAADAAAENIITGQTAADCDGTATIVSVDTPLEIATAGDHTVYFNIADTWAASGDANATASGTIIINWDYFPH